MTLYNISILPKLAALNQLSKNFLIHILNILKLNANYG